MSQQPGARGRLLELGRLFLRLGATSFGGPAVHIALMHQEVVERRRWLTPHAFLDLLGATNLIPGPNSTEMAIHIGYSREGWRGLAVAGLSFIVPAVLLSWALAIGYVRFGALPAVQGAFAGMAPVVVAVVAVALVLLARSAIATLRQWLVAGGATLALTVGVDELVVLAAAGIAGLVLARTAGPAARSTAAVAALGWGSATVSTAAAAAAVVPAAGLGPLFLVFLKAGALLFGSGYVLFAFLRADLVDRLGWLSEAQLLDAIAVGQMTPGPLFTTATFIGYLLAGTPGAAIATAAIFVPAFAYVAVSGPIVPQLRRSPAAAGVLDGVTAASLAMMAVVTWRLGLDAIVDPVSAALAVVAVIVLLIWRVNAAWLIAAGAVVGLSTGS